MIKLKKLFKGLGLLMNKPYLINNVIDDESFDGFDDLVSLYFVEQHNKNPRRNPRNLSTKAKMKQ